MKYLEFANKALEDALITDVDVASCKSRVVRKISNVVELNAEPSLTMNHANIGLAIYSAIQASAMEQMKDCSLSDICVLREPGNYISFDSSINYCYMAISECCDNNYEGVVGNIYHVIKAMGIKPADCFTAAINFIEEV